MDEAGHEIPLRKTTMGDRKTINMIDDSRRLNKTDSVIPIKITDKRKGKVSISTVK